MHPCEQRGCIASLLAVARWQKEKPQEFPLYKAKGQKSSNALF